MTDIFMLFQPFPECCPCLVCILSWFSSGLKSLTKGSGTVGMLAVPGLNGVAQIAAFGSILCALSAVLTGTLLISNHRGRMESTGRAAVCCSSIVVAAFIIN